ncbi:MAG: hypothetical protein Q8L48_39890 [Archangium sp.]|nr:hypothetical protein [Archangium sp.]
MRTTALLLVTVLALGSTSARADEPPPRQRGFLSALGLGLLIGGLAGVGAGAGGVVGANDATVRLGSYGGTFTPDEKPAVDALQQRIVGSTVLAVTGFVGGGLALVAGVTCLLLDSPRASVAFVPTSQGGVFVFSGRF